MSDFRRNITIAASSALSAVLGSIHAFSVFIPQWENLPGADRASVSLIYSIALVSLTIAVLFGYRLYQRVRPAVMFVLVGSVAASGLMLSAGSASLVSLYLTYGFVFGGANGIGYGYILQLAGQAAPSRRGLAMGLVTAFYAVGASAAPLFFVFLIARGGNTLALKVAGAIVFVVSIVAAALVYWAKARYVSDSNSAIQSLTPTLKRARLFLWVGYGSAVTAGLMVSGWIFDRTGTYSMALLIAVLFSGISIIAIRYCLPNSYEWTQRL